LETLAQIQQQLKAPKGQTNAFGKYKYRSCEDIMNAVKPHLGDWSLIVSDEIVLIGDRYYVKATAKLRRPATKKEISKDVFNEMGVCFHESTAYAREPLNKKGMDEAQITGATSSYARKYCLAGLFAIDNEKDADATNDHNNKPRSNGQVSVEHSVNTPSLNDCILKELKRLTNDFKDEQDLVEVYTLLGVKDFKGIQAQSVDEKTAIITRLKGLE
jgi:hypothetical protein